MLIDVSILIDAPQPEVYAILTDYGSDVRKRINPELTSQTVIERHGNEVVCDNVWDRAGRIIQQRRRYLLFPPGRIEEEALQDGKRLSRIVTEVEEEGDQTRMTVTTDYRLTGVWRILGRFIVSKLREADDELLLRLKAGIEAEFEDDDT